MNEPTPKETNDSPPTEINGSPPKGIHRSPPKETNGSPLARETKELQFIENSEKTPPCYEPVKEGEIIGSD